MDKKEKNSSIYTITDPLLEPYYIQYDQYCYTAIKKIVAGTSGRERDQTIGYYSRSREMFRCDCRRFNQESRLYFFAGVYLQSQNTFTRIKTNHNKMKLKAIYNAVILKPYEFEEELHGNIIVPDLGNEKNKIGKVVSVGEGITIPGVGFVAYNS
jgi:hypothetical protein